MTIAVKTALLAEKELGKLAAQDLKVSVTGSRCLGDTLQGLTQARLANPPRFTFEENEEQAVSVWEKGNKVITIALKDNKEFSDLTELSSDLQFEIQFKGGV